MCFRGEAFDRGLIHVVEGIVIDWSRQIHDVLKKNSAQPLLEGKNPGPLVEIEFWDARRADLESIADQLCVDKVTKMGHLLEKALSSYYPAFQSMIDTVFGSLEEARDIRYNKPEYIVNFHFTELKVKAVPLTNCTLNAQLEVTKLLRCVQF